MEVTWQAMVILGMLLIGILVSIGLYASNSLFYDKHQTAIRKIYYGVILTIGYLLWATKAFPVSEIVGLTLLVISIVVIDLFVFQTPVITKFLSQEFKPVEAVKTIENTDEVLVAIHERILNVNQKMPKAGGNQRTASALGQTVYLPQNFNFGYMDYEDFIILNLEHFLEEFHLSMHAYPVASTNDSNDFFENINRAYDDIRYDFEFSPLHEGVKTHQAVQKLLAGESVINVKDKKSFILLPFWGLYYNTLFVIYTPADKEETTLHLADVPLILNLLYVLELWLYSYECCSKGEVVIPQNPTKNEPNDNVNSDSKDPSNIIEDP
ncbi:type II toxin-antitoxin system SpoIISA family toxin [Planococcus sp. 1R117A]|uniref:type II toxin-antitoxin system SpoIISA family toxin n=1 Tax=Planococcus sp. 1R117A TaxID=3447020 RepID=UPI003EDC2A54